MTDDAPELVIQNPVYKGETCRACRTPLVFVLTPKGHREPLERDGHPWSHWDDLLEGEGAPLTALRIVASRGAGTASLSLKAAREHGFDVEEHPATLCYVSHFATCPSRDLFRRRGR